MYGQNRVIHYVFIYAGLEGINIISLAVLRLLSDLETFLGFGDFSLVWRLFSNVETFL